MLFTLITETGIHTIVGVEKIKHEDSRKLVLHTPYTLKEPIVFEGDADTIRSMYGIIAKLSPSDRITVQELAEATQQSLALSVMERMRQRTSYRNEAVTNSHTQKNSVRRVYNDSEMDLHRAISKSLYKVSTPTEDRCRPNPYVHILTPESASLYHRTLSREDIEFCKKMGLFD